jgi:hypothetical protein
MDPRELFLLQQNQNLQAARRSGKTGVRLLDDGENNVGNATKINPQILPTGEELTTIKQSNPPRVLNLTAASKSGQSMTVVMAASRLNDQNGVAGPITGILEFGNGTQSTKVEFDVPLGPYQGNIDGVDQGTQPEDGGAIIQIPTGVLRAYARYDNAYITPNLQGHAFGQPGSASSPLPANAGPFAPGHANPVPPSTVPPDVAPVNVKAFAAYYGRVHSKLYKTLYLYNGSTAVPVPFGTPITGVNVLSTFPIPPFAKSVQVIRTPYTSAMILLLSDLVSLSGSGLGGYNHIPSGPCPTIPIIGNQTIIGVSSASNADTVSAVSLVFEIGF